MYLKAQGPCLAVMVVLFNGFVNTLSLGNSFWLSEWTSDPRLSPTSNASTDVKKETSDMYLGGLAGFGFSNSKYIAAFRLRGWLIPCVWLVRLFNFYL